jgi:hypothetical protein
MHTAHILHGTRDRSARLSFSHGRARLHAEVVQSVEHLKNDLRISLDAEPRVVGGSRRKGETVILEYADTPTVQKLRARAGLPLLRPEDVRWLEARHHLTPKRTPPREWDAGTCATCARHASESFPVQYFPGLERALCRECASGQLYAITAVTPAQRLDRALHGAHVNTGAVHRALRTLKAGQVLDRLGDSHYTPSADEVESLRTLASNWAHVMTYLTQR